MDEFTLVRQFLFSTLFSSFCEVCVVTISAEVTVGWSRRNLAPNNQNWKESKLEESLLTLRSLLDIPRFGFLDRGSQDGPFEVVLTRIRKLTSG